MKELNEKKGKKQLTDKSKVQGIEEED